MCFGKAELGGVRASSTLKDGTSDKKEKTYMRLSKQKLRDRNSVGKSLGQKSGRKPAEGQEDLHLRQFR